LVILSYSFLVCFFKIFGENYVSIFSHSLHTTLQRYNISYSEAIGSQQHYMYMYNMHENCTIRHNIITSHFYDPIIFRYISEQYT
jgi:hypothetical protein